ncbi:hypothetical protein [Haloferula sp.]|uniref:hypothetical protein n=1 Tax=Haloferula sp. TaxID=2497595 RepID=UPI00329FACCF
MNAPAATERSDARLWLKAMLVSVVLNVLIIVGMAFLAISSFFLKEVPPEPKPETRSVTIVPVTRAAASEVEPEPEPEASKSKSFARSSPEQASTPPENPRFIGERDTKATSDAAPVADAPEMPSQKGEEPKYGELETTESNYQDGYLAHELDGTPGEAQPAVMEQPENLVEETAAAESEEGGTDEMVAREEDPAPPAEKLAETPFPVDRPVLPMEPEEDPKSAPEEVREDAEKTEKKEEVAEKLKPTKPSPAGNPGFRGNQRKTALKGSISRSGHSALDIEAGALGKYQAAIGRAIEKSWQRKVIENSDYVLPGTLSLRVVLDPNGKVRSVLTVNELGIGAIQRGFTHSAIRDARLPAMPAEVKKELDGDPLELLYNFIF